MPGDRSAFQLSVFERAMGRLLVFEHTKYAGEKLLRVTGQAGWESVVKRLELTNCLAGKNLISQ